MKDSLNLIALMVMLLAIEVALLLIEGQLHLIVIELQNKL